MKHIVIAIDGPAASGKSTIAKKLAEKLSYLYIDTGAMYRAIAFSWLETTQGQKDTDKDLVILTELLKQLDLVLENNSKIVKVNGRDLSDAIRSNQVSNYVSYIASFPVVRSRLVDIQRNIASNRSIVMDGRDIGTVVFPHAEIKIYMTASAEVRAARRFKDLEARNEPVDLQQLIEEIKSRDLQDSSRATAPLKKADDAVEINTDDLSIDQVVEKVLNLVRMQSLS